MEPQDSKDSRSSDPNATDEPASSLWTLASQILGTPSYPPRHDPVSWLILIERIDSLGLPEKLAAAMKAISQAAYLAAGIAAYAGDFSRQRGLGRDYSNQLEADDVHLREAFIKAQVVFGRVEAELIEARQNLPVNDALRYEGVSSCAHAVALRYIELIQNGASQAAEQIGNIVWDEEYANQLFGDLFRFPEIDAVQITDEMVKEAVQAGRKHQRKTDGTPEDIQYPTAMLHEGRRTENAPLGQDIPRHAKLAQSQYENAVRHAGEQGISLKTDEDTHKYLREHLTDPKDPNDNLPDFGTWRRYLSEFRRLTRTSKNQPRRGRTGRSIVGNDSLD